MRSGYKLFENTICRINHTIRTSLLIFISTFLCACGNHAVLDVSEINSDISNGQNPIGMVEAQNLNPESSFGLSIRYPYQENIYCGAFIQEGGEVVTNADCIQHDGRIAEASAIRLILKNPNTDQEEFEIDKIILNQSNSQNNWVILLPKERDRIINTYGFIPVDNNAPSAKELKEGIATNLFTLDKPNNSGIAKLKKLSATLNTKPAWEKSETKAMSDYKRSNPQLSEKELKSISSELAEKYLHNALAESQLIPVQFQTEKVNSSGGILIRNGAALAVLSQSNSMSAGKAHWLPGSLKKIKKVEINYNQSLPTNNSGFDWIDF